MLRRKGTVRVRGVSPEGGKEAMVRRIFETGTFKSESEEL